MVVRVVLYIAMLGAVSFAQSSLVVQQVQSHLGQAQELLRANRPDLAIGEFREILKIDPTNVGARSNVGTLLYFKGDFQGAAPELRAALASDPTLWKTEILLGMCEKRIGQIASARADLEKAFPQLQEQKLLVETGMELIEIYYTSGELEKAAGIVNQLRQLDPSNVEILYTAHRIYAEQADEAMLSVAMLAPNSARMHQLMAQQMVRQGNTKDAKAQFQEALKLNSRVPGLHFELAEVLSGSSSAADREEAEKQYQASLQLSPFDEKSECRLGRIASTKSDLKGAVAHYSRALQLQPDDFEANLGLAKAFVATGQSAKAKPLLEHAVRLDPTDPVGHFRLGTLYRQLGRTKEASGELADFQRLKEAKERLKNLYQGMRLHTRAEQVDADLPQ